MVKLQICGFEGQSKTPPPFLEFIPPYLRCSPGVLPSSSHRRRQCSKRSGVQVRLRAYLLLAIYYCYRWLKLVIPEAGYPLPCCRPGRIFSRAFVQNHLRLVGHVSQQSDRYLVHMALINTRSLPNKTFILNNFFTSHFLDFLLLTETWNKPGDNSAFSELLPPSCSFLNSPQASGRGWGLTSKENFRCRFLSTNNYTSFELQLFLIELTCQILCALVYCPPKYNKDFIQEFSEFSSEFTLVYDKLLICGDFNIHICCLSDQFATDFKRLCLF